MVANYLDLKSGEFEIEKGACYCERLLTAPTNPNFPQNVLWYDAEFCGMMIRQKVRAIT